MNEYLIEVTESAQNDLREIVRYIQTDLTSPGTAERFLDGIEKMLEQLAFMPQKFQYVRDDRLASKEYRYTRYKSYLIFYTVDDNHHFVYIHRILHSSRQWEYLI